MFDIIKDVEALTQENVYKQVLSTVSKAYMFNTDDFAQNDPDLIPKNHALSDDQLREYGCLVSQLRNKFEDKGIDMLRANSQDNETAAECFHSTVKRL